jgi:type IV pilus assembly protein PilX
MSTPLPRAMQRADLRASQTGATLIVGLMLLLVLTVLGVSGMNTATMEITMAANTQFHQDAFQMTEDAIDIVLGNRDYTTSAPTTLNWLGNPNSDRRAVATYRWPTPVPAGRAFSLGVFSAYHFDIQAVGLGPRNARSEHTQSFYVVGLATP